MDIFLQIVFSALTVGSIYAVGTIALSLLLGTLSMLNLAHGTFIAAGGYSAYWAMKVMGANWIFALPVSAIAGVISGYLMYHLVIRWLYARPDFEIDIIIVTVAIAALGENIFLNVAGPEARRQPFHIDGGFHIFGAVLPYQTILTVFIALVLLIIVAYILGKTKTGLVIRAVSQQRDASKLMGINVSKAFGQAIIIAGSIAAVSGVLVTGMAQVFPGVGSSTTLKALVIVIIAGIGNLPASVLMAFLLGAFEVTVQYIFGARYGFPAMLGLVIIGLIWRPYGIFGKETITRV